MSQDEQYLNLLAVFHWVVAGLTALLSCVFFIHLAMGIVMLRGGFGVQNGPPPVFGWFFIVIPAVLILGGWALAGCMVAAGVKLKQRRSHTFCLVVAGIECIFMPFGTVLGVFTIVVLMKDSVKQLFAASEAGETAP